MSFSAAAGTWLRRTGLLRDLVRQEVVARQLAAHLGQAPLDVLDVGCGQGTQALRLAEARHRVVGVEPSAQMRSAFSAAADRLPSAVRERVELVPGALEDLDDAVGGRRFDVVLCHGVLMYLPGPEPALTTLCARMRPGGLLSLLVRNADAIALRPGLRRDWAGVQRMLDAAEGDRGYVNELGVRARADRVDELAALLGRHQVRTEAWYGVRCLTDGVSADTESPTDLAEREALLGAETRVGRTDPYRRIGTLCHLIGRADRPADHELRTDQVAYDSPIAQGFQKALQDEYVLRYGGRDATPVDPREFDPPAGLFLVQRLGGEPVAGGGYRRHDERSAELKRMYVRPDRRRRGIGRALLAALEDRARIAGYQRLVLETGTPQPEALRLYASSGYAPIPGFGLHRDSPCNRCLAKAL